MTPEQVSKSYDHLAAHWAGPDFDRSNGLAPHRRALRFIQSRGAALDVGCGSSGRFVDLLLESGFKVEGLDLSAEMLRLARARHPHVLFHRADICTWEPSKSYDFISAWDSIWHVPLVQQRAVLAKLCTALTPGGVLIFTIGGVQTPGETNNPCLGQPMYHAALGIPEVLRSILQAGCTCRHLEYDQYPELHVFIIVQKR